MIAILRDLIPWGGGWEVLEPPREGRSLVPKLGAAAVMIALGAGIGFGFGFAGSTATPPVGAPTTPPSANNIVWENTWDTTGTSRYIMQDSSGAYPWPTQTTSGDATWDSMLSVVAAPDANFTTTNALKIRFFDVVGGSKMLKVDTTTLAEISTGESLFYRWEDMIDLASGECFNAHLVHGGVGDTPGAYVFRQFLASQCTGTTYGASVQPWAGYNASGAGTGRFDPGNTTFSFNTVYRWEFRVYRTHADSGKMDAKVTRISDETLIASSVDFLCQSSCGGSVGDALGAKTFYLPSASWKDLTGFELGNNGNDGTDSVGEWYVANWAIAIETDSSNWIGAN